MRLDGDTQRLPWTIRLTAPRRLAIVVAVALFVYSIGPAVVPVANRVLVTWNAASLTYLTLYWLTIMRADAHLTRQRAHNNDQAARVIFLLVTNAACASIVAIGFVMGDVKIAHGLLEQQLDLPAVLRRDRLSARIRGLLEIDEWRRSETTLTSTPLAVA